jgi:3,4-dihydroxy 2-butanone 4-phosphate synthase / GTP cyclohydrolase II
MKTLDTYLQNSNISTAEFARRIGCSAQAVDRYRKGDRTPRPEQMTRIFEETKGAVTPNDFLGITLNHKEKTMTQFDTHMRSVIDAFAKGEIVIVTDDETRENEGDLIIAASHCTTEKMAFIIRNCCGIVCAPVSSEYAKRLNLSPMVATNDAPLGTAFTVSVDVKHGLTTGISAEQRANTVRALANPQMNAADFVRPGHVFPLIAKDGGVLMRSGHTEAAVDLCKLAGLTPVGVICELANDDGTVMQGDQIVAFAQKHNIKRISVDNIIAYRQSRDSLVESISTFKVQTDIGEVTGHTFITPYDDVQHFAFVYGDIGDGTNILARLHRANVVQDVLGNGKTIERVLAKFKTEGRGVLVYLRDGGAGVPSNSPVIETSTDDARQKQWKEIGLGAQILRNLGIVSIRNLTSKPRSYVGLSGFGIEITGSEGME